MHIKIECGCGETYETEFEPVNGVAPNPIVCPNCATDATESINSALQQQPAETAAATVPEVGESQVGTASPPRPAATSHNLATGTPLPSPRRAALSARPPLRKAEPVAPVGPPPLPAPPSSASATPPPVSFRAAPVPVAAAEPITEAPAAQHCFRHTDRPVEMFCFVCKKPICAECMEMYGFVCSPYCRRQAKDKGLDIPEYEKQRDVVARKSRKREKLVAIGAVLLVFALLASWVWYAFLGSKPHVVHTVDLGQGGVEYCRFIGPDELLVASARRVAVYDPDSGKPRWTTTAAESGGDEDVWGGLGAVFVAEDDLWLQRGRMLVRLDRRTGAEKDRLTVDGPISRVVPTESSLVVYSSAGLHQMRLTRIDFGTGQSESQVAEMLYVERKEETVVRDWEYGGFDSQAASKPEPIVAETEFVAAGPNVAQINVQVLKTNIVSYKAIKATGQQRADSEMKVSEMVTIAEEIMTDMARQRTGGVRWEDESAYTVTLRRLFGDKVAEWRGEVTGRPALFALPTVDVLVAGKQLRVFDKQNQLLWESTLTFPIAEYLIESDENADLAPCREAGETLYFFDQGVLTAFARDTGTVRWRLASVGISQIDFDADGKLYVTTTTASPEDIQYTQQVKIADRAEPVILKVEPATGKILWRIEKKGERFYLADGFVYFTRESGSGLRDFANAVQGQATTGNLRIYRVHPRKGKAIWEYHREGVPEHIAFQGSTIVLITDGHLEILRCLTF